MVYLENDIEDIARPSLFLFNGDFHVLHTRKYLKTHVTNSFGGGC